MSFSTRTAKHFGVTLALIAVVPLFEVMAQGPLKLFPSPKRIQNQFRNTDARIASGYYQLGVGNLREPATSDRAIEHLERAVGLDHTNAEYHYMLAEAYMANYQIAGLTRMPFLASEVREHLELAVKYGPTVVEYREALVEYYAIAPAILGGSYQKAYEQAREIAKLDPYLGYLAQASIYVEEGEGEKALDAYRKAIRTRPAAWQAYQRLGTHYLNELDTDQAIAMFMKYVEAAPDQAESYRHLGMAYQQKRMYSEAINAFRKALEKDPSIAPLVFRIAQLHEFQGNKRDACEHYQRYLSMVPSGKAADDARVKVKELAR
jgi:tetratricopeptide (TPR) repeat protein